MTYYQLLVVFDTERCTFFFGIGRRQTLLALILFGPQGSGKGTQGRMLEDLGFHRIDFGDRLRRLAEKDSSIRGIINGGSVVDDETLSLIHI